jgi:D-beta-D-heptose 7-phosphate kinase/D-beta-D-heptose 1-phosphate adenosyltransferase
MGQVVHYKNLSQIKDLSRGKKLVFTNGCFDLLHIGHIRYLQQARSLGDVLVVGVNSDRSVQELKGPSRPIQNQDDRAEILSALGCVDFVVIFDESTPKKLIESLTPDILVKGGDWKPEQIVGSDWVLAKGGQVLSLQFVEGRSTTEIVSKLLAGSNPRS